MNDFINQEVSNISDTMLAQLIRYLNLIILLSVCHSNSLYQFASPDQEQHYYEYIGHIRCLVCQNESIKDSNAPLASQLRAIIYDKMIAGNSDDTIDAFLTERYGEFVNYTPELNIITLFLWAIPLMVFAFFVYRYFVKK